MGKGSAGHKANRAHKQKLKTQMSREQRKARKKGRHDKRLAFFKKRREQRLAVMNAKRQAEEDVKYGVTP